MAIARRRGWHPDPWRAGWRWWNGAAWSIYASSADRRPILAPWLSWPVVIASPLFLLGLLLVSLGSPLGTALALLPAAAVLPFLLWVNSVQPEPAVARAHALLWGAVVATSVAGVVNDLFASAFGEAAAAVVSAPVGEELMKGMAVVWAFRRGEVVRRLDAVVYALWAALGFTLVEDALYLYLAESPDEFWQVFVSRSLVPPYVHLLFSAVVALGIWWAVSRRRSVWAGLLLGAACGGVLHAAWNAAAVAGEGLAVALVWLAAAALSVALVVHLASERRRQEARLASMVPFVLQAYGLGEDVYGVFRSGRSAREARRSMPRRERARFDATHNALVRLAEAHFTYGVVPAADADALVDEMIRNQVPHR